VSKQPAVYILSSKRNGTLYVGVTSDLVKRVWAHKNNLVEGFTKRYGVHQLVWYEMHESMEFEDLKARVISARICAARAVNRDLILLYWDIGHGIVEKQKTLGWGDAVVEMVAADLRRAFPASQSFSPDNLGA
jgi:hypothetical protein